MMARLSASERSTCTCGRSAPGTASATGSAPVASNSASQAMVFPSASVATRLRVSIAVTRVPVRRSILCSS